MCQSCDWMRALDECFPASRRQVLRGAGVFMAAAVVAPSLGFSAETPRPATPADRKADWLFLNGTIYTVNPVQPSAQAVAVLGDQIVYVGDADAAKSWRGPATRVVDLHGRMLLPGFVDAHNHLAVAALTKLGINIRGLVGKDKILDTIREWIATQPLDAPLRGHGWTVGVGRTTPPRCRRSSRT